VSPPPIRPIAAAVARFGRYACFLHDGRLHVYELAPGVRSCDMFGSCRHLGPAAALPECYLKVKAPAECIRLAAGELRDRLALAGTP